MTKISGFIYTGNCIGFISLSRRWNNFPILYNAHRCRQRQEGEKVLVMGRIAIINGNYRI